MPLTVALIAERIEHRWDMPLASLLRDFGSQGLSQRKTAAALGVDPSTLRKLVAQHGVRHHFVRKHTAPAPDCKEWIGRIEAEAGQPIDQVLRQEAAAASATGTTMTHLAAEFKVPRHRIYVLCDALGIKWPRVRRKEASDDQARN